MSGRNFVFTLNNYTSEDEKNLAENPGFVYVFYGREVAPTTGTKHLQGFVVTKDKVRPTGVAKLIPRAHVELMKGKFVQNATYCGKSNDTYERGERPRDSNKNLTDWKMISTLAKAGKLEQILDENPAVYIRCDRALKRIHLDYGPRPEPLDELDNYWYVGPPGTGKTRTAYEKYPGCYIKNTNKWWDGYNGEAVVLIDELEKTDIHMGHFLKIWCQNILFQGESKGGAGFYRFKTLVVTSNYTIEDIFGSDQILCDAISRRFKIVNF